MVAMAANGPTVTMNHGRVAREREARFERRRPSACPAHPARAHGGDRRVGALDRRAVRGARDRGAGVARRVGAPGRYVAKVTVRPGRACGPWRRRTTRMPTPGWSSRRSSS